MKYYPNSKNLVFQSYAISLYENFRKKCKKLNLDLEISFLEFLLIIKAGPEKLVEYWTKGLGFSEKILEDQFLLKENGKHRYPRNIFFEKILEWDEEQVRRFALNVEEKKYMSKNTY